MNKVERIKADIDRLQETTMDENRNFLSSYHEGIFDGLSMIDNFIDSLEEEPVSEDLKETATKYARKQVVNPDYPTYNDEYELESAFETGAKWGMEQAEVKIQAQSIAVAHGCPKESVRNDLEEAARKIATRHSHITGDTYYANDAWFFKKGAQWQKEQIIDKAFKYINYQLNFPSDLEQHFRKAMEE